MIEGFPTFDEMERLTILGSLATVASRMKEEARLGNTELTVYDYQAIEGLVKNRMHLEEMGYEVGFDFPDHLDWHKDEVFTTDIKSATIRWDYRYSYTS